MRAARSRVQSFRYPAIQSSGFCRRLSVLGRGQRGKTESPRRWSCSMEIAAAVAAGTRSRAFHAGSDAVANAAAAQAIEQERSAVILRGMNDVCPEARANTFAGKWSGKARRLALAIARKILHREGADGSPAAGRHAVRVALDQMQTGTRLLLRTSPDSAPGWAEFCAKQSSGRNTT